MYMRLIMITNHKFFEYIYSMELQIKVEHQIVDVALADADNFVANSMFVYKLYGKIDKLPFFSKSLFTQKEKLNLKNIQQYPTGYI